MSYCPWAKKNSGFREFIGDHFFVSLTIIENILPLAIPLEMLLDNTIIECKKNRQLHKKYCFS